MNDDDIEITAGENSEMVMALYADAQTISTACSSEMACEVVSVGFSTYALLNAAGEMKEIINRVIEINAKLKDLQKYGSLANGEQTSREALLEERKRLMQKAAELSLEVSVTGLETTEQVMNGLKETATLSSYLNVTHEIGSAAANVSEVSGAIIPGISLVQDGIMTLREIKQVSDTISTGGKVSSREVVSAGLSSTKLAVGITVLALTIAGTGGTVVTVLVVVGVGAGLAYTINKNLLPKVENYLIERQGYGHLADYSMSSITSVGLDEVLKELGEQRHSIAYGQSVGMHPIGIGLTPLGDDASEESCDDDEKKEDNCDITPFTDTDNDAQEKLLAALWNRPLKSLDNDLAKEAKRLSIEPRAPERTKAKSSQRTKATERNSFSELPIDFSWAESSSPEEKPGPSQRNKPSEVQPLLRVGRHPIYGKYLDVLQDKTLKDRQLMKQRVSLDQSVQLLIVDQQVTAKEELQDNKVYTVRLPTI